MFETCRDQDRLNVDETGHKENGERKWTWCFRAGLYTLFKIDPTRSGDVLMDVLGKEFNGVLGCDYFSAYRRYHREFNVVRAVLPGASDPRREVPDDAAGPAGSGLRGAVVVRRCGNLFGVIHRREEFSDRGVPVATGGGAGRGACTWGRGECRRRNPAATWRSGSRSMGRRYFRFITTPGVEPTNNLAEQAIRFVVIDRQ